MLDKILTIATPTYGMVTPEWSQALRTMEIPFKNYEFLVTKNMLVDEARNYLISVAKGDYIFFLDSDVICPNNIITKLLEHDKDIVTGLYFQKGKFYPNIFKESDAPGRYDVKAFYEPNKLIEVASSGLGCCLIKKDVFKKIGSQEPGKEEPWFKFTTGYGKEQRESEDHYFFRKAREAGYKIYCDTSMTCGHMRWDMITEQYWLAMKDEMFPANKPIVN